MELKLLAHFMVANRSPRWPALTVYCSQVCSFREPVLIRTEIIDSGVMKTEVRHWMALFEPLRLGSNASAALANLSKPNDLQRQRQNRSIGIVLNPDMSLGG